MEANQTEGRHVAGGCSRDPEDSGVTSCRQILLEPFDNSLSVFEDIAS